MPASVITETFLTTVRSVVTVIVVYISGYILVKTKTIDQPGISYLARLTNNLLVPALYVSRLGGSLNVETLKHAWPISIVSILLVFLSLGLAALSLPIAKPSPTFRNSFLLGVAVPNVMAVPLVVVASICTLVEFEKPAAFKDKTNAPNSGEVEVFSQEECQDFGQLYVFLYTVFISFFVWTFGWAMLESEMNNVSKSVVEPSLVKDVEGELADKAASTIELRKQPDQTEQLSVSSSNTVKNDEAAVAENISLESFNPSTVGKEIPSRRQSDGDKLLNEDIPITEATYPEEQASPEGSSTEETVVIKNPKRGFKHHSKHAINVVQILSVSFSRPINSSQLVGIFIGLIEPLQHQFFSTKGVLQPIMSGISIIGGGAICLLNIVMACTVALKLLTVESIFHLFGHEEKIGVSSRTLFFYVFGRMLFLPAIHIAILYLLADYVLPDDKLLKFVLYFISVTPTANMVIVLTQVLNQRQNAEIMAIGGLFQYLVALISLTAYTFLILLILDIV